MPPGVTTRLTAMGPYAVMTSPGLRRRGYRRIFTERIPIVVVVAKMMSLSCSSFDSSQMTSSC